MNFNNVHVSFRLAPFSYLSFNSHCTLHGSKVQFFQLCQSPMRPHLATRVLRTSLKFKIFSAAFRAHPTSVHCTWVKLNRRFETSIENIVIASQRNTLIIVTWILWFCVTTWNFYLCLKFKTGREARLQSIMFLFREM